MDVLIINNFAWDGWLTLAVIGCCFLLLLFSKIPADFVLPGGLIVLTGAGVLDQKEALNGFSTSGLATIGLLYVVVAGVKETETLSWIFQNILGSPGSLCGAKARLIFPVMVLSAFLNNTPVVAIFIPAVQQWAQKIKVSPSQLLLPLSYASIFGGILTMIGTSTNLLVNDLMVSRLQTGMGMFEITYIGLPCAIAGAVYLVFSGKLLPAHNTILKTVNDNRKYIVELMISKDSPFHGKNLQETGFASFSDGALVAIVRNGQIIVAPSSSEIIIADDRLIFSGIAEFIRKIRNIEGAIIGNNKPMADSSRKRSRLIEAIISESCPIKNTIVADNKIREHYNGTIIAVSRDWASTGDHLGDIVIKVGDNILIDADEKFLDKNHDSGDFLILNVISEATSGDQKKAPLALFILVAMIAVAALGVLDMLKSAALAALLILIFRCCTFSQARSAVEWNVLIVIGAALGLGRCVEKTGIAAEIAGNVTGLAGGNPYVLLAIVYMITVITTEFITNNAAAALIFPIAVATAEGLSFSPMPFVIAVMIGASASFSTPIGYQTNLMVCEPGGYRFCDYLKFGIPLSLLVGFVVILLTPLFWPFQQI